MNCLQKDGRLDIKQFHRNYLVYQGKDDRLNFLCFNQLPINHASQLHLKDAHLLPCTKYYCLLVM